MADVQEESLPVPDEPVDIGSMPPEVFFEQLELVPANDLKGERRRWLEEAKKRMREYFGTHGLSIKAFAIDASGGAVRVVITFASGSLQKIKSLPFLKPINAEAVQDNHCVSAWTSIKELKVAAASDERNVADEIARVGEVMQCITKRVRDSGAVTEAELLQQISLESRSLCTLNARVVAVLQRIAQKQRRVIPGEKAPEK